jgi:sec-independent protein translocase protein TatA
MAFTAIVPRPPNVTRVTIDASLPRRGSMDTLGWPELLVIGLVFVVLFGAKKIPDIAKGMGEGIRNFKSAVKGETQEIKKEIEKV